MEGVLGFQQRAELSDVLRKYSDVFSSKPGHAKVEGHSVRVTPDCCPKRLKPYRVPIALQEEVDRQIKELLELDLIEPSDSDWAHPVVCVAKKNGSVRLCIDFRLLNSFTIPDAYPMKIARDLLYEVGKANFISVLDLTKGYWQIPMKEEARHFTAFVTHSGHFQWKVLPFGMKNAGSTFQRSMDKALAPHREYCRSYIDDVAIYSQSWRDHLLHIDSVFRSLREVGLTVNLEKCAFGQKRVKFLGHIVGSGQHSPDPEKAEVVRNLSRPSTKKELRSFLGLASYYRDYIPNFSEIVLPLTDLTKRKVPNVLPWSIEAGEAFVKIKDELVRMPTLHTPDISRPFWLYTDASATAIGACLAQHDDVGKELPIAFFSKKLTPTQMKWSTIEREAFCVLEALKKFDTWIFGGKIQVVSDHNPLTYLTSSAPHGAKLSRWALALQRYNLTISYRRGIQHGNADALSRLAIDSIN
ncbi:Retrovirus-related Pol polyprotein from transposon 297 [Araneus ventricosus]|uniref:RNA-directed DNA polymerase n=1 Tax=Araneus ventricosus TaxID=182803 RepID=A0A4Y2R409_ARAVE|nr:Retrovirus-related Pol polyprotein from transposon 297 [Araneus ventricosus]